MKWLSVVAAVVLVVLTMHPGGGSTLDILPLASCLPDCTGVPDGGKTSDPTDCTQYYKCMFGEPAGDPTPCGPDEEFNPAKGLCEAVYGCKPTCTAVGGSCTLSCKEHLSFIADVTDCSAYHVCTPSGTIGPYKCPGERPYFDGIDCVKNESVCCIGYCEPFCGKAGDVIPDPKDCTKFYLCEGTGDPKESDHFTCPSGQIFDLATLQCVTGDANSCVTLCDAAGGGGGGGDAAGGNGGDGGGGGLSGCVSSLTCSDAGNYAACDTCDPQYFDCKAAGAAGVLKTCPDGYVFNRNSNYPICVTETNCS